MSPSTNGGSRSASFSSQQQNGEAAGRTPRTDQELAQAFRELARGEQTASALEANLTSLESKLDALLASFENMADVLPPASSDGGKQADKDAEGDDTGRQTPAGDRRNNDMSK